MTSTRYQVLVLCLIVFIATALRVYRLDDLIVFLGDQGRDVTAVQNMIENGQPALLGPGSGIGKFRRGPAYYYLLLPAQWLALGDPLGAGIFIALADAVSVVLMFLLARALAGTNAGYIAAALYACALVPIVVARGFSNPSLLPLLTLGQLYSLWRIVNGQDRFLILLSSLWLLSWQLHDQVWLLLPPFVLALLLFRPRFRWSTLALTFVSALVLLLPFLWYELQHDASNLRLMLAYVGGSFSNPSGQNGITNAPLRLLQTLNLLASAFSSNLWLELVWVLAIASCTILLLGHVRRDRTALFLLPVAMIPLMVLVWPGPIYALNVAIALPVPFILVGYGFAQIPTGMWQRAGLTAVSLFCLVNAFFVAGSIRAQLPGRGSYLTARQIAAAIISRTAGSPFAFEMFTDKPTEAFDTPYLYLLKRAGLAPTGSVQAMRVQVYDPAGMAPANSGVIFQNIRVLVYAPPAAIGPNLLETKWRFPKGGMLIGDNTIELTATETVDTLSALYRLPLDANATYLLQFDCHNALSVGDQLVFMQTLNDAGAVLGTFPIGGYKCSTAVEWQPDSVLVQTPPGTKHCIVFLRNHGLGKAWFRNVRLQKAVLNPIP